MKTLLYIAASTVLVVFAYWAYSVNYATQHAVSRVETLQNQISMERETIGVLRAEWAYLNRPDRLRELAETHFGDLQLMPMNADHFDDPTSVAFPKYDIQREVDRLVAEALLIEVSQ